MNLVDVAIELGLPVASLAGWTAVYGIARLLTRPTAVRPAPASMELPGPESPAVVSLLVNQWRVTVDAAESTLLDLAARGYLELRQAGPESRDSTVHPTGRTEGLNRYERQVLDRVIERAVGGVVPLTALAFADEKRAASWSGSLGREVVAEARRLGLTRPRFPGSLVAALSVLGVVAAFGVSAGVFQHVGRTGEDNQWFLAAGTLLVTTMALATIARRDMGERDTPQGRLVAARWLGLRTWLAGHEAFADLPPAAVAVWERYLSYGAALGVTRVASQVIHLGLADRSRIWSAYGGAWRQVDVSYPDTLPRYGQSLGWLFFRALGAGWIGWALVGVVGPALSGDGGTISTGPGDDLLGFLFGRWLEPWRVLADLDPLALGLMLVGSALLGYAGYTTVRVLIALSAPGTVSGEVIWYQMWQYSTSDDSSERVPVNYYLVIDDGRSNQTRAWVLPRDVADQCELGDVVSATVRQWTRRVKKVTVLRAAPPAPLAEEPRTGASTSAALGADSLLTVDELGAAVGRQVRPDRTARYVEDERFAHAYFNDLAGRPAVSVSVTRGRAGRVFMTVGRGTGQPLPTPQGDEAYLAKDRVVGRRGDVVVLLQPGQGVTATQLAGLLPVALARVADQSTVQTS